MTELSEVEIGKRIKKAMHNIYDSYHTPEIQKEHEGALDIVNAADYETWEKEALNRMIDVSGDCDVFWDSMETLYERNKNERL